jgi:hypothetical protein
MEQQIYEDVDFLQDGDAKFTVNDDATAEWVLAKLRAAQQERDRLVRACKSMIEKYQDKIARFDEKYNQESDWWKSELAGYFARVPHKSTKTQEQYALPSGKLILKQQQPEFLRNDDILLQWLKDTGRTDHVKVKESPDWAGLKKKLSIQDDKAYDPETGEVVPGVSVQQRPPVFNVVVEGVD